MKHIYLVSSIFSCILLLLCGMFALTGCNATCTGEHTVVEDAYVAPSCTDNGLSAGSHCSVCQLVLEKQEVLPALGHASGEWTQDLAASCSTDGTEHRACTVCEAILEYRTVKASGHTYGEWTEDRAASCQQLGEQHRTCATCSHVESESIPTTTHTPGVWEEDFAAGCMTVGARHRSCIDCSAVLNISQIPSRGHSFEQDDTVAPPCDEDSVISSTCRHCHKTEAEIREAHGHTPGTWRIDLIPTCSGVGRRHLSCKECNGVLEVQELPQTGHNATVWETLSLPTAVSNGKIAKICSMCNQQTETHSISKNGNTILADLKQRVDLSTYTLVYSPSSVLDELYESQIQRFVKALNQSTGLQFTARVDTQTAIGEHEILLGPTNRWESVYALSGVEQEGFAIRVINEKPVINATNDITMLAALQYFISTQLTQAQGSAKQLCAYITVFSTQTANFSDSYSLVLDSTLHGKKHSYVGSSTSDCRDYPSIAAESFVSSLSSISGKSTSSYPILTDTATATNKEILFGFVNRAECKQALAQMDGNEYGIFVQGSKLILTSHNDPGLKKALNTFLSLYAQLSQFGITGLPDGFTYIGITDENWIVDFPRPDGEGISLYNSQNNNNDSLQFYYTGTGVNHSAYTAYCQKLASAGYRLLLENSIESSYFATYVNDAKGISVYVGYNAFLHRNEARYRDPDTHIIEQPMSGWTSYHPLLDYAPCLRVISAPLDNIAKQPHSTLLRPQSYQKVTDTAITAFGLCRTHAVGMCYIITLEDGRFVVFDGGRHVTGTETGERDELWQTLNALHADVYGSAPTQSNPIRIAAWYVTHSHMDHYHNFNSMMSKYASTGLVRMDYLIGNFPESSTVYPVEGEIATVGNATFIPNLQNTIPGGFDFIKVHTGYKLYLANLEIEVLMTYEDHNPRRIDNSNDTNTVSRLTFSYKNNSSAKTTFMILGDSCVYQSRYICAMFGDHLQSDMVQLAHHGNIGCENALYDTIKPTVVWYPHSSNGYKNWTSKPSSSAWPYNISNHVVHNLSSVQYIYISGMHGSSSTGPLAEYESLTLEFSALGVPQYDAIYNPLTGSIIPYSTGSLTSPNTHAIQK